LQRFLAEAGVAARRKAEVMILDGRVRVNGRVVTELGTRVQPRDRVELDGQRVVAEHKAYVLLHKPRGYVSTLADPEGRPTVMALLPKDGPRLYPVGRLDFNTEGLLLFTNDGELANGLMHPRREVPKTYHVKARGVLSATDVEQLESGIELDGAPRKARVAGGGLSASGKQSWIELVITEGRNRQVHRMMEAVGQEISRLVRVGYGPLTTEGLTRGKWRLLTPEELDALAHLAGVEIEAAQPKPAPRRAPPPRRHDRPSSPRGGPPRGGARAASARRSRR
jgi:23S rRNA pseudouridine2605 synthase